MYREKREHAEKRQLFEDAERAQYMSAPAVLQSSSIKHLSLERKDKNTDTQEPKSTPVFKIIGLLILIFMITAVILCVLDVSGRICAAVGSAISILSSLIIFSSAYMIPQTRRHPNTLLLWKTLTDLFMTIRLIWTPVIILYDPFVHDADSQCLYPSAMLEFFGLASQAWTFVIALDLWKTVSYPFMNYSWYLTNVYHPFCWITSLVATIILSISPQFLSYPVYGFSTRHGDDTNKEDQYCWYSSKDPGFVYALSIVPGALMVIGNIFICLYVAWSLKSGLEQTFLLRVRVTIVNVFTNVFQISFSILIVICYFIYISSSAIWAKRMIIFLLASVVFFDLIVWIVACQFRSEMNEDVTPQANEALRTEFLKYIMHGIIHSLEQEADGLVTLRPFPIQSESSHLISFSDLWKYKFSLHKLKKHLDRKIFQEGFRNPERSALPESTNIYFSEYEPAAFYQVRRACNINTSVMIEEIKEFDVNNRKPRLTEGGAGGAVFFFSKNNKFIIKSITDTEANFWRKKTKINPNLSHAQYYANFMRDNPNTYLTKVYGVFSIKMYKTTFFFYIMENIFSQINESEISEIYDLKGSFVDRSANPPKENQRVTCKNCNMKFTFSKKIASQGCRFGNHEPRQVFKDNDLKTKIRIVNPKEFFDQLEIDTQFLSEDLGVMDYSLLVGVHREIVKIKSEKKWGRCLVADEPLVAVCYYVGVIDILQEWTTRKKIERWIKRYILQADPEGISTMPPNQYRERFLRELKNKIFWADKK